MEHVCTTLGCYLRCLNKNSSQNSLANKLGVSKSAVSKWLNDKKRPRKETLLKLCAILRAVPEKAFAFAGYELDPFEKSWYVEMQIEALPLSNEYERMKRQLKYLRRLMKGADLRLALDFGIDLRETLREYVKKETAFLPLLFDVLDELSQLYLFVSSYDNVLGNTKPIFLDMKTIQQELDSNIFLGMLLDRQGDAFHLLGRVQHSKYAESLQMLSRAAKLIPDPNRLISVLQISCIDLCQLGKSEQFDYTVAILESKMAELGEQVDAEMKWHTYERLAISNATMWDKFHEERYYFKSKEMLDKAKLIFDKVHQRGEEFAVTDLRLERAELRLAFSHIIELTEEEKLTKARNIMTKAEKLGDPKVVLQMKEFLESTGKSIPDLSD